MIIETIFSTVDEAGKPNFAPMGLLWEDEYVTVRPYRNTQTCANLLSTGYGVANITDNVLAYVQSALYEAVLPYFPARIVEGVVFVHTCSWRELEVVSRSCPDDRAELQCRIVHTERQKDFLGFCRAGNAVIEAAILATRLAFLDRKIVDGKMIEFVEIVEKTGGAVEKQALQLVREYIGKAGNE
ncbi:MAG: DUF447 family protein [Acidobacteriota bacterium]|jgi:hypothetical protein